MSDYAGMMRDAGKAVARWMRESRNVAEKYRPAGSKPQEQRKPGVFIGTMFGAFSPHHGILDLCAYSGRPYVIDPKGVDKTVEALIYAEEFECAALLVDDNEKARGVISSTKELMDLREKQKNLMKELCIGIVRKHHQKTVNKGELKYKVVNSSDLGGSLNAKEHIEKE